jgi:putative transposase
MSRMHKHLQRLDRVWIAFPVYFLTVCTFRRRPILIRPGIPAILLQELKNARERHGWAIGSYVVMPDHVHFFCAPDPEAKSLSSFMREWKSWTSRKVNALLPRPTTAATTLWQREFFDHILRSDESYAQKWSYVRDNPVRAGLVRCAEYWPYVGTVEDLEMGT